MFNDLSIPLTMKFMALGHPLHAAECLAAVILIQVVVLCTMMGYRLALTDGMCHQAEPDIPRHCRRAGVVCTCGIFPAFTGTEADTSRALLFTQ
jgi:hypothetical protein